MSDTGSIAVSLPSPPSPVGTGSLTPSSVFNNDNPVLGDIKQAVEAWKDALQPLKPTGDKFSLLDLALGKKKGKGDENENENESGSGNANAKGKGKGKGGKGKKKEKEHNLDTADDLKTKLKLEIVNDASAEKTAIQFGVDDTSGLANLVDLLVSKGGRDGVVTLTVEELKAAFGGHGAVAENDEDQAPRAKEAADADEDADEGADEGGEQGSEQGGDQAKPPPPNPRAYTLWELNEMRPTEIDLVEATDTEWDEEKARIVELGLAYGYRKQLEKQAKFDQEVREGTRHARQIELDNLFTAGVEQGRIACINARPKPALKDRVRQMRGKFNFRRAKVKEVALDIVEATWPAVKKFLKEYGPALVKAAFLVALAALCNLLKLPPVVKFLALVKGTAETVEAVESDN